MSATPATRTDERAAARAAVNAAVASSERPPRPSALANCLTFGWRGMLKIKHVPEQLLDVTVTPVLFLLMFTYLFGGAVAGLDRRVPAVHPARRARAVGAVHRRLLRRRAQHRHHQGRRRPLPLAAGVAAGAARRRGVGDSARYVIAGDDRRSCSASSWASRPPAGRRGVVAAIALVVVFTFGLCWVFTTVGLIMRAPNAVLNTGFMVLFPLVFLSNIFVEPSTLPGWLEASSTSTRSRTS